MTDKSEVAKELRSRAHSHFSDLFKATITVSSGALFLMPLSIANLDFKIWLFLASLFLFVSLLLGLYSLICIGIDVADAAESEEATVLNKIANSKDSRFSVMLHLATLVIGISLFLTCLGFNAFKETPYAKTDKECACHQNKSTDNND